MIINSAEVEDGRILESDLCIVGSGPAGIAIAKHLEGSPLTVLLLESGGFEFDQSIQRLYEGELGGRKYFPLDSCRLRYFGGSSNCWAGLCRPLDPEDFAYREWVPNSGWPISNEDIEPWYEAAANLLGLDNGSWVIPSSHSPAPVGLGPIATSRYFKLSAPERLGVTQRASIAKSRNVTVCLNSTATRIRLTSSGREVASLRVARSRGGGGFVAKAKHFVIACGGIENARLLLVSDDVHRTGVGNAHDVVGRYFMEHPHTDRFGTLIGGRSLASAKFYSHHRMGRQRVWGHFMLTAQTRAKERLLSAAAVLLPQHDRPGEFARALRRATVQFDGGSLEQAPTFTLGTPSEQVPNVNSRVTVGLKKDFLGVPKAVLDWRLTPLDKQSVEKTHELLARAFAMSGLGRMRLTLPAGAEFPSSVNGGRHHMGTTRMHASDRLGVVDSNCRVHGVSNLYLGGSSVFTTSGSANPTFTIAALAFRLAEHLKRDLAR